MDIDKLSRAQGCFLGQLAGDALGAVVESQSPEEITDNYPDGLRELKSGGVHNIISGQPTDDSEMALLLARMLAETKTYEPQAARREYQYWLSSGPFSCGRTTYVGLTGNPNPQSQANGAMMRVSPLGIFGARFSLDQVAKWAMQDAEITHPNLVCQQANALFAMGIAYAVKYGCTNKELYRHIRKWAVGMEVEPALMNTVDKSADRPPADFIHQMGWVLIAFQNALYQLLHAPSLEDAVIDSVMQGGDTDTNAAICGALLGAVHGREAVPDQWLYSLQNCRPDAGDPGVHQPRPECFWPVDVLELSEQLIREI